MVMKASGLLAPLTLSAMLTVTIGPLIAQTPSTVAGSNSSVILPPTQLPALNPLAVPPPLTVNQVAQAGVKPNVKFNTLSAAKVYDVHLRPLYETAIRLPSAVSSVAVGAPTLFEEEHKDAEPNIVFVKPSTHGAAQSNLLIALTNGETISMRLISPGDAGSTDPVDFVVNYHPTRSFFAINPSAVVQSSPGVAVNTPELPGEEHGQNLSGAQAPIGKQDVVGAPHWMTASELSTLIKENAKAPNSIALAIGEIYQTGETMTVSFSVLNISNHWVTIMPPQVELTNPLQSKKDKKKNGTFADPILALDTQLKHPKLSPGARADGSITFTKPDSKLAREGLLLHVATSAAIDTPMYYPLPFVAPSEHDTAQVQETYHASR